MYIFFSKRNCHLLPYILYIDVHAIFIHLFFFFIGYLFITFRCCRRLVHQIFSHLALYIIISFFFIYLFISLAILFSLLDILYISPILRYVSFNVFYSCQKSISILYLPSCRFLI